MHVLVFKSLRTSNMVPEIFNLYYLTQFTSLADERIHRAWPPYCDKNLWRILGRRTLPKIKWKINWDLFSWINSIFILALKGYESSASLEKSLILTRVLGGRGVVRTYISLKLKNKDISIDYISIFFYHVLWKFRIFFIEKVMSKRTSILTL